MLVDNIMLLGSSLPYPWLILKELDFNMMMMTWSSQNLEKILQYWPWSHMTLTYIYRCIYILLFHWATFKYFHFQTSMVGTSPTLEPIDLYSLACFCSAWKLLFFLKICRKVCSEARKSILGFDFHRDSTKFTSHQKKICKIIKW